MRIKLHRVKQLADSLDTSVAELNSILDDAEYAPDKFFKKKMVVDPSGQKRDRQVISVGGKLRRLQERLLANRFRSDLLVSENAHGSVRKRSIVSNAKVHLGSRYAYASDVESFFPSISHNRIYRLFVENGYAPDVARACTRICTFKHHLALGLVTSPMLANAVFFAVDQRIDSLCKALNLRYSRYVDDLVISGDFAFEGSGIAASVSSILHNNGFKTKRSKEQFGTTRSGGFEIAGIRLKRRTIDVKADFLEQLLSSLDEAKAFAISGVKPERFLAQEQLWGKVQFAIWVNNGRKRKLTRLYYSIDWKKHAEHASRLGLEKWKTILVDQD